MLEFLGLASEPINNVPENLRDIRMKLPSEVIVLNVLLKKEWF